MQVVPFAMVLAIAALLGSSLEAAGPIPKEGLLVPKARAEEIRQWVLTLESEPLLTGTKGIRTIADRTVAEWPAILAEVEPHVPQMLDLLWQSNAKGIWPQEVRDASKQLGEAFDTIAFLGFMYFVTAEQKYADTAYEILELAGRIPRWGWFNWDGANMPQIHYGQITRTAAFCLDFCWDGWNADRRKRAAQIVAEKGVESYWRIVSLQPFMALHHLRAKNQGNNALSAALIASIAVGDSVPENRLWFDSLLQTYCWIITHDIGWAGTNLESGLDGYWNVSMQNLYTAVAALNNARGIDLRSHPAFAEATWYPVMHEATVGRKLGGPFNKPYAKDEVGLWGMIEHKPIELPQQPGGSAWWYDYAAHFPDSPAAYYVARTAGGRLASAHQRGHAELMNLLWVRRAQVPVDPPRPTMLFKAIDREAMFRSGYGSPHTYLSFNGDLFLSARNEVLGCTGGMGWHYPWHQYAVTESVLETEGSPFSPSMLIYDSFDSPATSLIRTRSASSNVKYYRRPGQARSHLDYRERARDIAYVRSDDRDATHDYFVFVDRVAHDEPRWHAFNWHIWNQPGNEGRYERIDARSVVARRPNAALLLATLSHDRMTYEEQGIPSQPNVSYVFDHNARLLRGIAGGSEPTEAATEVLPAKLWSDAEAVRIEGRDAVLLVDTRGKSPQFKAPLKLAAGNRYEVRLDARKEKARIYENIAWTIDLKLLDAAGNVLLDTSDAVEHRAPGSLRLTDPASNEATYLDWRPTTTHFTAPPGVTAVEATLRPAKYGHSTGLSPDSKFWFSEMTFRPLGTPVRTRDDMLVTLVMPLENSMPVPQYTTKRSDDRIEAEIVHPSGNRDRLMVARDGQLEIVRIDGGEKRILGPGVPNLAADSLRTNSSSSQEQLRAGLKQLADTAEAERDHYLRQGWKNVAREAKEVTASAARDDRFAPRNVIDNKTWEMPLDGVVDYTLGDLQTPGNGGYGRDAAPYETDLTEWPLYFRPTYWLLPPRKPGEITIHLKQPTPLRMVRLLNTTNAGLNDFAATDCRVELLIDDEEKPVWSLDVPLGKPHDHAFQASFVRPDFFASYGDAFRGMLEPGVRVPFGEGWVEVPVEYDQPVSHVRIRIEKFWAVGGGLNEVQVYAR